jgi:alpha-tubulin suppressor-like RCC1 family protein
MSRSSSVTTKRPSRARTAGAVARALGQLLGLAGTFAAATAASACLQFDPFGCEEDTQCDAQAMGRCEAMGWCSYPDGACGTGFKYEANAGDGLGGECVGADATGTGTGSTSEMTEPVLDTGQDSTTATTGPDPSSSSDDDPTMGEACGGGGQACCTGEVCDAGLSCSEGLCGCVQAVAVGDRHTCAVKLDGSVWCWGDNDLGQLATVEPAMSPLPVEIAGFGPGAEVEAVVARLHTCAIRSDATVLCWGDNASQKASVADPSPVVVVPAEASLGVPVMQVGVGGTHTCVGLGVGQAPTCWGANASGQLSGVDMPGPVPVAGGFEPFQIALGQTHTCMSTLMGALHCWGANAYGQLAADPLVTPTSSVPLTLAVPPIGALVVGAEHTCVVTGSDVQCWGRNNLGQLGNGTNTDTFTPTLVTFPPGSGNIAALVAAADQTCAVTATGAVLCWGGNQNGELLLEPDEFGEDGFALAPRAIELGFAVSQLATGVTHSCALSTAGQVLCWGDNGQGQIGDGTVTDALEPTPAQLSCP